MLISLYLKVKKENQEKIIQALENLKMLNALGGYELKDLREQINEYFREE